MRNDINISECHRHCVVIYADHCMFTEEKAIPMNARERPSYLYGEQFLQQFF